MARFLKGRLQKLDAKRRHDANRVVGVIGGLPETYVEKVAGVHYLRRPETPTGEAYAPWAKRQQDQLQQQLADLMADDEPKAKCPVGIVGNDPAAPLKPGQKAKNFIYLADGTEIKIKRN